MDLLYSRYSRPLDLMNRYINQGRFGKFVSEFLDAEYERRREEARQERDRKLWQVYIRSDSKDSFETWKTRVCQVDDRTGEPSGDINLDNDGIEKILTKLFPKQATVGRG